MNFEKYDIFKNEEFLNMIKTKRELEKNTLNKTDILVKHKINLRYKYVF